ncbi:TadE/TadG family type IV pilus assembly protein [Stappia sp. ES.058]|uniref:TadE/TadG family type IV pilus assembly protein n=1 Tax=Stappia sp. ES.058 TaxID=1881061 RepID=UPI00087BF37A|nr:TadE/TadG family type IV pilus assembly protein [Stappia sp. ES.058]SDT88855.1 Flp pilus assembly protein TadG [Stappia sp. ES.058]
MTSLLFRFRSGTRGVARLSRLCSDTRGVAAVEFALVLPFMLLLFLGMVEMNSALTLDRKVSQTASALADLVAQTDKLSSAQINDLMEISEAMLAPYPSSGIKLVVASVWMKDVNKPQVVWSRGTNTSGWSKNSPPPIDIPESLTKQKDTYLIVSQANYTYRPTFAAILKDVFSSETIELSDTYFMRPRISTNVECCN